MLSGKQALQAQHRQGHTSSSTLSRQSISGRRDSSRAQPPDAFLGRFAILNSVRRHELQR